MQKVKIKALIIRESLFFLSLSIFILSTLYLSKLPSLSIGELQVFMILFAMFVIIKGLEKSRFIRYLALKIEYGNYIALKLILSAFFVSMFLTNDVALMTIVPLTLSMRINKKDLIIIYEAIAANAGSALTPFGNPQNLFIYWYYNIDFLNFLKIIFPFSLFFLIILIFAGFKIKTKKIRKRKKAIYKKRKAFIYLVLFIFSVGVILKIFPFFSLFSVFIYPIFFDRRAFKIDYFLLFTFLLFFGISENFKTVLEVELSHPHHIFLLSALLSQIISNVPTAILLSKFTQDYEALLWGVSAGGFGTLIGSLANLIAYKFYVNAYGTGGGFTGRFLKINFIFLLLALFWYYVIKFI